MGEIVFIGLGLHDENGISLRGLEEVKAADSVFIELYTSLLPDFSLRHLEEISGREFQFVSRKDLEENNGERILKAGENGKAALLVPGDPLIATTHVTLRIEAEKRRIRTRVIHGASALSAVIGLSGLQNYKFGKSVTIPFPDETSSETPYQVIRQNAKLGLHTLCFLDVKTEEKRYLSIREALKALLTIEAKRKEGIMTANTLAIGIARAGSTEPTVKAGFVRNLMNHNFGKPPHSIVFPGELHFTEAEALVFLADAPRKLLEDNK